MKCDLCTEELGGNNIKEYQNVLYEHLKEFHPEIVSETCPKCGHSWFRGD